MELEKLLQLKCEDCLKMAPLYTAPNGDRVCAKCYRTRTGEDPGGSPEAAMKRRRGQGKSNG